MQKVTYINALGETVEFAAGPPFVFNSIEGTGAPETTIFTSKGIYQHGDTARGYVKEPRFTDLRFHIDASTRADMYALRVRAERVLSVARAFRDDRRARLVYENDYGKWWIEAVPEHGLRDGHRIANYLIENFVSFRCGDPFWRAMSESNIEMALVTGAFRFPMRFPITFGGRRFSATAVNRGQVDAQPVITLYGAGEMPKLANHTTGTLIELTRPIEAQEILTIVTDPNVLSVTITDRQTGQTLPADEYLTIDSAVSTFVLAPGDNKLEYYPSTDDDRTRLRIAWYDRYEGV